jgi:hypothetical protein
MNPFIRYIIRKYSILEIKLTEVISCADTLSYRAPPPSNVVPAQADCKGNSNSVKGSDNSIEGESNVLAGNTNDLWGDNNILRGNQNTLSGFRNKISGG